jgi:hypothetical protein
MNESLTRSIALAAASALAAVLSYGVATVAADVAGEHAAHSATLSGLVPIGETGRYLAPDITVAPCGMAHVPAHTRTDVCVADDGSLVSRYATYTAWTWRDGHWSHSRTELY